MSTTESTAFEPRIVGLLCNWCSYAGADKAGSAQRPYPANFGIVKVMCSGRIDPQFVLAAFQNGADGVVLMGCHLGDCHYKDGNRKAVQRHRLLLRYLAQFGIEAARCRFEFIAAGEADKFVAVVTAVVDEVRALGPLRLGAI